jgi:hypothetical protein
MFVAALRLRAGCKVAVEPAETCPEKYELEAQMGSEDPVGFRFGNRRVSLGAAAAGGASSGTAVKV